MICLLACGVQHFTSLSLSYVCVLTWLRLLLFSDDSDAEEERAAAMARVGGGGGGGGRMQELLASYYGMQRGADRSSDVESTNFDARQYVRGLLQKEKVETLLRKDDEMVRAKDAAQRERGRIKGAEKR